MTADETGRMQRIISTLPFTQAQWRGVNPSFPLRLHSSLLYH